MPDGHIDIITLHIRQILHALSMIMVRETIHVLKVCQSSEQSTIPSSPSIQYN
jgi:hypothetical protein